MSIYVELAVTTNFSFLRGASHPQELVTRADELGLSAIGIADRNSFAGVVRAYDEAKKSECHLSFEDILNSAAGQIFIALPPANSSFPVEHSGTPASRGKMETFPSRLAALADAAPGRTFLAGVHYHRGDEPRRFGLLAE